MKERIGTAFILGAGLGTRLRPLTENCPKPLLPVGGRPLITYSMDHLIGAGVNRFIVNTHHCPERYADAFPDGAWRGVPVTFRFEPVLLETAGGIKNIEDLVAGDERFFVYNGDVLTDLPLEDLIDAHFRRKPEATLALRSEGPVRNVDLDEDGNICDMRGLLGRPGVRKVLFSGVYIVERSILRRLEAGRIESIVPVFVRMIRVKPGSIAGVVIDRGRWRDVGSVSEYEEISASHDLLQ
ncbi:MAG: nucleotidyltransferase family protein [Syntrophales bacterium]|nr:nucleotidyltransferase family protein [Syntrophales bacterium]